MFNKELGAKFQQADSLIVTDKDEKEHRFSIYKFEDVGNVLFTLYTNKQDQLNLLKSIKKIDYILKCEGFASELLFSAYLDKVKKLKNILAAFEIEDEQIKSKEKEIFA